MKQFFFAALLLCSLSSQAQQVIPNGDFEGWRVNSANTEAPASWLNTEEFISGIAGIPFAPTNTVSKTTNRHSGSFAVLLQTQQAGSSPMPGNLILGDRVKRNVPLPGGKPFTSRPASMSFYYMLTGTAPATDSAKVTVVLTRYANDTVRIVGGANLFLAPAAAYTPATVPIDYTSGLMPDSVYIMIFSGSGRSYRAGTSLYIDDMVMSSPTATKAARLLADLSVYPNPSSNGLFFLQTAQQTLLGAEVQVTDVTGRLIWREPAGAVRGRRVVDLRGRPAGLYTVRLLTADGPVTRALILQ